MKVKGGDISQISTSPSGQVVAHVVADDGRKFMLPFGMPVDMARIVKGVEDELSSHDFVKAHAARLHAQLGGSSNGRMPDLDSGHVGSSPTPPAKISRTRRLWIILSWYFRRKK